MKKILISLIVVLMCLPMAMSADGYTTLWKQYDAAGRKDLPKTQLQILGNIVDKASKEQKYGHLLKAQLLEIQLQLAVSPDSLLPMRDRMEAEEGKITDRVLAAVYQCALGKLYEAAGSDAETNRTRSREYFKKAMENPELLAKYTVTDYLPLLVDGADSRIFGDDLLHVIGFEARDYKTLHDYYLARGNRAAACICAYELSQKERHEDVNEIHKSKYLQKIDSLIEVYKDLPEAGELAIEHYNFISQATDATAQDKMRYINYALSRWGAWPRMNILRNAQSDLTRPEFNVSIGDELSLPGKPRKVLVNSVRNINTLTMNVYRLKAKGDTKLDPQGTEHYRRLMEGAVLVPQATQSLKYFGMPAYKEITDTMTIVPLQPGVYMVEISTDNKAIQPQRSLLHVSNLFLVSEELPGKNIRMAVVNATNGRPVAGAKVRLTTQNYYGKKDETQTLTCNSNGEAMLTYSQREPNRVYVYTDDDVFAPEIGFGNSFSYYDVKNDRKVADLFTDRRIYRPGQTVHVAAVAYTVHRQQETQVDAGRQLKFTLRDANYKPVAEKQVTTDDYGTASVDFTLPQSGLTGVFTVETPNGSTYISVEEYKRPTFQVEFDEVKQKYENGDTLTVVGHARSFAGVPVQGAVVKYTVERRPASWWWYRAANDRTVILLSDTLKTDDKGEFRVRMPMELPVTLDNRHPRFYRFSVSAHVTDAAGESREGEMSLPLSTHPTAFSCDIPQKSELDSLQSFSFSYKNNAGKDIPGVVNYTIDGKNYEAKANEKIAFSPRSLSLASGKHMLTAVCGTDTLKQEFVLFTMEDKQPAIETHDWFYQTASEFPRDGGPVYVQAGSSDEQQHIVYTLLSGNKVLESGVIDQSNAITTRRFTYQESYGNGLLLTLAWVRDGVLYSHRAEIRRPLPDKRLNMKWTTFRDRLTPGQKEEWTLHISRPDGRAAQAQLLATLYDKSLDEITAHRWHFNDGLYLHLPSTRWSGGNFDAVGLYGFMDYRSLTERPLDFSHFDEELFGYAPTIAKDELLLLDSAPRVMIRGSKQTRVANAKFATTQMAVVEAAADTAAGEAPEGQKAAGSASSQLRENLNETAFFYPNMETDAAGNVKIKFTLPESITTWRFLGFAHDREMNNGMTEAEAVAQKTVMVQPNVPRFVRMGDKALITARVFNTSAKQVGGTARMELLDAETQQLVYKQNCKYQVQAGGTATVSFDYKPQQEGSLLICRIVAEGKSYSDGEQHYLPVLPDKELVTHTVPFTQNMPGVKRIDLSAMLPAKHDKSVTYTFEYTNNPAWLLIQALPTVARYNDANAISLAAAYYANSIAADILHQSPAIKQTIELWKQEKDAETSLMSSLQKNEELRQLVLNETPWVADADREADQKQLLINFFDESVLSHRQLSIYSQLLKLQNPDGSFSWWPGMRGSMYMTTAVTKMLVRLNTMTGKQPETAQTIDNAFRYMDSRIAEEVRELKKLQAKGQKNLTPSETACDYLYTNALAKRRSTPNITYLVGLLSQQPSQLTIYGKANSAVILAQYGHREKAAEYLQSMNEYSVYKEETGRYFDTPKARYSWFDYRIPTQVAAIEALKALKPADKQTVEEMQRWLLQAKRTQSWDTPLNSVNAVYAFLNGETSKLSALSGPLAALKVDGKRLDLPKATAGLGYVKTTLNASDAKTFEAEKQTGGTSWGAVYAQFYQQSADVSAASAGLSVKRELIHAAQPLKIGDKVKVRLTITADRDYDFVQVQDKRAACLEPVGQLSGYRNGYYCTPRDNATKYYFDRLPKGKHVIETEYFIDRTGTYQTGICTVQCAYSPEFSGRAAAQTIVVE